MADVNIPGNGSDTTGNGTQGNPYKTVNKALNGNTVPAGTTTLYVDLAAPAQVQASPSNTTGIGFNNSALLRVRPYGAGQRAKILAYQRAFSACGSGSLDWEDVDLEAGPAPSGNYTALLFDGGGTFRMSRSKITRFFTSIRAGGGADGNVLVDQVVCDQPTNSGIVMDTKPGVQVSSNGIIRRCSVTIGAPTKNDPFVLHDGGIGVATGWLVEDNEVLAADTATCESGIDIQQQWRGTTVRRNKVTGARGGTGTLGATGWGYTEGDWICPGGKYGPPSVATRALLLSTYYVEGQTGTGTRKLIGGGHCVFVTADSNSAYNGIYQFTGSNPGVLGSWVGPMVPGDLEAVYNKVYENEFYNCTAGMQIRHPGSQFGANIIRGMYGSTQGAAHAFYIMGSAYGIKSHGLDIQMEDSAKAVTNSGDTMVRIQALNSLIPTRTRLTLKGSKLYRPTRWGATPFISIDSAADLSKVIADYNAYVKKADTDSSVIAQVAGVNKTFEQWKTDSGEDNSGSDVYPSKTNAGIDEDNRIVEGSSLIGLGGPVTGFDAEVVAHDIRGIDRNDPCEPGAYAYDNPTTSVVALAAPERPSALACGRPWVRPAGRRPAAPDSRKPPPGSRGR